MYSDDLFWSKYNFIILKTKIHLRLDNLIFWKRTHPSISSFLLPNERRLIVNASQICLSSSWSKRVKLQKWPADNSSLAANNKVKVMPPWLNDLAVEKVRQKVFIIWCKIASCKKLSSKLLFLSNKWHRTNIKGKKQRTQ